MVLYYVALGALRAMTGHGMETFPYVEVREASTLVYIFFFLFSQTIRSLNYWNLNILPVYKFVLLSVIYGIILLFGN